MSRNPQNQLGSPWRAPGVAAGLLLVAIMVGLHLPRAFLTLPLYAGDEGAYLIRALFSAGLKADPSLYPTLPDVDNTVFFWIVRLVYALPGPGLDTLRLLGGGAYIGGLILVWRGVRPYLPEADAAGVLLLALIFPYYRFVFSALPEGWYVGLLGLIICLTARFYRPRPWLHAASLGALTAVLVLIKPHGVAVAAGFVGLVVVDAALDAQRRLLVGVGRIALFAAVFLLVGHGLQALAGHGGPKSLLFFGNGFYSTILGGADGQDAGHIGQVAFFTMGAASLLLAGVPIILGLDRLGYRWGAEAGRFQLRGQDLAFLLTLLAFGATLVMVAMFAAKISGVAVSESFRLWGRYFEFFTPLLWLTAWPYVREAEAWPDRHVLSAGVVLAGLAGLAVALKSGVALLPWDGTAVSAFFIPNSPPWPEITRFPFFALASMATLGLIVLTLVRARTLAVWQAYFAVLGILSVGLDQAWWSSIAIDRDDLVAEAKMAQRLIAPIPGPVAVFTDDPNAGASLFLAFAARPHLIMTAPGAGLDAATLAPYRTAIVEGGAKPTDPAWRLVQTGKQLRVYQRGSLDTPIR
ncbi:hypothetical protein [Phenylobacterium aquaticum]|uniref:hypothetical protein n=1 Tax=Phenylobacterium aquaticum TaxID=1763816 RepID=UPI0026EF910B|nr:hypothetical protein [Phenylobacterium aquaticum]